MDDRDLQLLRSFRADEAEPPAGLQGRIEERLWQAILQEEAGAARGRRQHAPVRGAWLSGLLRPALAGGMALALAIGVAVVSDGGSGPGAVGGTGVTQANLLDRTASTLFGGATSTSPGAPIVGTIDLRSDDRDDSLVEGPRHDALTGQLEAESVDVVEAMPRDPAQLLELVRAGVEQAGYEDDSDALAFRVAMRWIVDASVPVELRASMLRALGGLNGIDGARTGVDVLGRDGIVVGHLDQSTGVRTQVVVDPRSGTLREVRSFTTTYVDPACEPGTFTEHAVYGEDGAQVEPASLPWVDWPLVVEACGEVSG